MSEEDNESKLHVQKADGTFESMSVYELGKNKKLTLYKNIIFPAGSIFQTGPKKVVLCDSYMEAFVAIGKDHTARLLLTEEALMVLRNMTKSDPFII